MEAKSTSAKQKTTYYIILPTQNSRQGKDMVTESSSVMAGVHTGELWEE